MSLHYFNDKGEIITKNYRNRLNLNSVSSVDVQNMTRK